MYNKKLLALPIVLILILVAYLTFTLLNQNNDLPEPQYQEYPLSSIEFVESVNPSSSLNFVDEGRVTVGNQVKLTNETVSMPIYQYTKNNNINQELVSKLAETVGIQNPELEIINSVGTGEIIKSSDEDQSIVAYKNFNTLEYAQYDNTTGNTLPTDFNPEKFQLIAQSVVDILSPYKDYYRYTNYAYYIDNAYEYELVNKASNASHIQYIYKAYIGDYPIVDKPTSLSPNQISVMINSQEKIVSVNYQPIGQVRDILSEIPIKSIEQLTKDIEDQKAIVVESSVPMGDNLLKTVVNEATLGYYPVNDKLIPVYIIKGTTQTDQGNTGESLLLLEAVDKSYYEE